VVTKLLYQSIDAGGTGNSISRAGAPFTK